MFGFVGKHISTTDFTIVSIFSWPGHNSGVFTKEDRHRGYHWCQAPEDHSALAGVWPWMDGWIVGWAWRVGSWGHQEAAAFGQIGNGAREAAGHSYKKLKKYENHDTKSLLILADFCLLVRPIGKSSSTRRPVEYSDSHVNLVHLAFLMACWNPGGQHPQQVWLHVRKAQG